MTVLSILCTRGSATTPAVCDLKFRSGQRCDDLSISLRALRGDPRPYFFRDLFYRDVPRGFVVGEIIVTLTRETTPKAGRPIRHESMR